MMNRIGELFQRKDKRVLSVYFTAGYPALESTLPILIALQDAGVDMIELGMPYSDPLADGPVIQESSAIALKNGMSIEKLFEQLKDLRGSIHIPVVLMGYLNPVLQYGFEKFCVQASTIGVDGLILPDLPVYEFEKRLGDIIKQNGLGFSFLVTPETSEERVKKMDILSHGFLYAVSSSSTTGGQIDYEAMNKYLASLQSLRLKNPIIAGFGIRDRQSFEIACIHANGAIVGTAFIRHLASKGADPAGIARFVDEFSTGPT